ncbi:MAG: STN domain-containing protein [Deltaproteobacteria bacterium]
MPKYSKKASDSAGLLLGMVLVGLLSFAAVSVAGTAPDGIKYRDGRLTLSVKNVPLTRVLEDLYRAAGFDVYMAKGLATGTVSVDVQNQPLEEALKSILRGYNYAAIYVKEGEDFRITALKLYKEGGQGGELAPLFASRPAATYSEPGRVGETRTVTVSSDGGVTVQGGFTKRGPLAPSQMIATREDATLPGLNTPWVAMQADIQTRESELFQQLLYLQKQWESAKDSEEKKMAFMKYTDQVSKFQLQQKANVNKVEALKRLGDFQGMSNR